MYDAPNVVFMGGTPSSEQCLYSSNDLIKLLDNQTGEFCRVHPATEECTSPDEDMCKDAAKDLNACVMRHLGGLTKKPTYNLFYSPNMTQRTVRNKCLCQYNTPALEIGPKGSREAKHAEK